MQILDHILLDFGVHKVRTFWEACLDVKSASQMLCLKGFSFHGPSTTRIFDVKPLLQMLHLKGFLFSWTDEIWWFKFRFDVKLSSQMLHSKFFLFMAWWNIIIQSLLCYKTTFTNAAFERLFSYRIWFTVSFQAWFFSCFEFDFSFTWDSCNVYL